MKFHSKPIVEHAEVPLADAGQLEQLISAWADRAPGAKPPEGGNACYVLSVVRREDTDSARAQLAEITGLVDAQGDRVLGAETYVLNKPDARTYIRSGVAERISARARELGANMLVLDAELSPSQTRNLEEATGLPICDREAVILNVFERHAKTRRARLQVEIAHLEYLRPRIRGLGLNMDQQTGGLGNKARGPGETASELLARRLDGRLAELRRGLVQLKRADSAQRKHRAGSARVALVGYTNAGKTSLMNALTSAGLSARDRPFETLDTTSRALSRHGGDVLVSDTVGFIRRLPERLFASFESTLAEACEASLLLVVVDVSDPEAPEHLATTDELLGKLGAAEIPRIVVFNKLDKLGDPDPERFAALSKRHPHIALSSHDPEQVAGLREQILEQVRQADTQREIFVPYTSVEASRRIYAECRVLRSTATPNGTQLVIEAKPHVVDQITQLLRSTR